MKSVEKSSSPALSRGLKILRCLAEKPQTLEELVGKTGFPKSSVYRLLGALVDEQVIRRDDDRRYRATVRLVPAESETVDLNARVDAALRELATQTDQTAEWYVPGNAGLILTRRAEPPNSEVSVRAKIGFVRAWRGELEAVLTVAYASLVTPPKKWSGFWTYDESSNVIKLSAKEAKRRVAQAREQGVFSDPNVNSNGVRRIACDIGSHSRPVGVLAIAQHLLPTGHDKQDQHRDALLRQASAICKRI